MRLKRKAHSTGREPAMGFSENGVSYKVLKFGHSEKYTKFEKKFRLKIEVTQ